MSKLQEYEKMMNKRGEVISRITGNGEKVNRLLDELNSGEEEALRMEILGLPEYETKKKELEARKDEVVRLRVSVEEDKKRLKILDDIITTLKDQVRVELEEDFKKKFIKKAQEFVCRLETLFAMEVELHSMFEECRETIRRIGGHFPFDLWKPVLMGDPGEPDKVEKFVGHVNQRMGIKIARKKESKS